MTTFATLAAPVSPHFELRFQSLFQQGRAWAFPCDAGGQVDMDHLSERARFNYLYARTVIGREVMPPRVCPVP